MSVYNCLRYCIPGCHGSCWENLKTASIIICIIIILLRLLGLWTVCLYRLTNCMAKGLAPRNLLCYNNIMSQKRPKAITLANTYYCTRRPVQSISVGYAAYYTALVCVYSNHLISRVHRSISPNKCKTMEM